MPPAKVIVTVESILVHKYGNSFQALQHELNRLAADPRFRTTIVCLDDRFTMAKYNRPPIPVQNYEITRQDAKDWIDSVFIGEEEPQYLVIFGCQDVVPFQRFPNPMYAQHNDTDKEVPSDLPYACNSPYSLNIANFTNPTRVVGRIPDLFKKADVQHVKRQVDFILSNWSRPLADYTNHIGLSAQVWTGSTDRSLNYIFGANTNQHDYPVASNPPSPNLNPMTHFINCHGALRSVVFQGEGGTPVSYPVALYSNDIGAIQAGTVVAAECCYGAHIHQPLGIQNSIASAYMDNKAAVFMGSSSIAFGDPYLNDQADIICQEFVKRILAGASTGRALLEARQHYIHTKGPLLSPIDAKTIAQFYILGDPSVQPVMPVPEAQSHIKNRRLTMKLKGTLLGSTTLIAEKVEDAPRPENLDAAIKAALEENQFPDVTEDVFQIANSEGFGFIDFGPNPIRFRIFASQRVSPDPGEGITNLWLLMIKEDGQEILETRVYHAK